VYAAKQANRGTVYAYEPHPENFELLQENVRLNGLHNVRTHQYGVLDGRKDIKLYVDELNNAGHSIYNKAERALTVPCVSLASIFDDNDLEFCDLLKMDCEGAEYDILFALPTVYFGRIGAVAMEYHDGMYKKKTVEDLIRLFEDNNFAVRLPDPGASQGLLYAKNKKV